VNLYKILHPDILNYAPIQIKSDNDATGMPILAILLTACVGKKRVLEIGTKHGQTAINIAKVIDDDGIVVTVDINQKQDKTEIETSQYFSKIQFIESDSKMLDFKTLGGPFDVIFIDGDHSIEGVVSDTEKALDVLSPGGLIIWHDIWTPSVLLGVFYSGLAYSVDCGLGYSRGERLKISQERIFLALQGIQDRLQQFLVKRSLNA